MRVGSASAMNSIIAEAKSVSDVQQQCCGPNTQNKCDETVANSMCAWNAYDGKAVPVKEHITACKYREDMALHRTAAELRKLGPSCHDLDAQSCKQHAYCANNPLLEVNRNFDPKTCSIETRVAKEPSLPHRREVPTKGAHFEVGRW